MDGPQSTERRRFVTLWALLALVVGILILGDLNRRMLRARELERDAQSLVAEVASLEAEQARLQTAVAGATSEAAIEAWARSEAKMVRDGDVLIMPQPASGTVATPTPTPTPPPQAPSNWEVWMALVLGEG